MDDMDRVQELNEQFLENALAEHYRQNPPIPPLVKGGDEHSESGGFCEDCGELIPEARRKAQRGCRRCIDCQTLHECFDSAQHPVSERSRTGRAL